MRRKHLTDIGLIGVSAFAAVSLIAASAFAAGRSGADVPDALTWDQAQAALLPAVPANAALPSNPTGFARPAKGAATPNPLAALQAAAAKPPAQGVDGHRNAAGTAAHGAEAGGDHAQSVVPASSNCPKHVEGGDGKGHMAMSSSDGRPDAGSSDGDHAGALPPGCAYDDGTVSANAPARSDRARTNVFRDPTGSNPWEINYKSPEYAEKDCGVAVPGTEAKIAELDPSKKCTMTQGPALQEGDPKEAMAGHGAGHECRVKKSVYASGMEFAERTRAMVAKRYDNQPWNALGDAYTPFPVPGTKTFHMFKSANYGDRMPNGSQRIFDPTAPEMFTLGMTDDGLVVVNVVYAYTGTTEELPDAQKASWFDLLPRPLSCMAEWHPHSEGVEGPATGNFDGRAFMTHVWTYPRTGAKWTYGDGKTYEGPYPYGEYGDGTEPHAWFTPLQPVPALCNKDGGCI